MKGSVAEAPRRWNFLASSKGMASAPEAQRRMDERSRVSAPASAIMRYMAGTPMNTVAFRCSIASSAVSGRNLRNR